MNVYVVVEGEVGEKEVYREWIPYVNRELSFVHRVDDLKENNFTIISGGGYPNYFDVIDAAIEDINHFENIDRLVVAVDSEDFGREEKYKEISEFISGKQVNAKTFIVVQHFCLETWALGNRNIVDRYPQDELLKAYRNYFDVLSKNPEDLMPMDNRLNRAQTAERYLRLLLNDKYRNLTYNKRNPSALLNEKYYIALKNRLEETLHIKSFDSFLKAFI